MARRHLFDPPPTDTDYKLLNLTRPLTQDALGVATMARRARDGRRSKAMLGRERPRPGVRVVQSPWTGRRYLIRDGSATR